MRIEIEAARSSARIGILGIHGHGRSSWAQGMSTRDNRNHRVTLGGVCTKESASGFRRGQRAAQGPHGHKHSPGWRIALHCFKFSGMVEGKSSLAAIMSSMLLVDAFPTLCDEIRHLLNEAGESHLAAPLERLSIVDRCRCGDDFCATSIPRQGPSVHTEKVTVACL